MKYKGKGKSCSSTKADNADAWLDYVTKNIPHKINSRICVYLVKLSGFDYYMHLNELNFNVFVNVLFSNIILISKTCIVKWYFSWERQKKIIEIRLLRENFSCKAFLLIEMMWFCCNSFFHILYDVRMKSTLHDVFQHVSKTVKRLSYQLVGILLNTLFSLKRNSEFTLPSSQWQAFVRNDFIIWNRVLLGSFEKQCKTFKIENIFVEMKLLNVCNVKCSHRLTAMH